MRKMDKITQLKVEIFDIIRKQEQLNAEFNRLEQIKRQKAAELDKLENGQSRQGNNKQSKD